MTAIKMTLRQATKIMENDGNIKCSDCPLYGEKNCDCSNIAFLAAKIYYEHNPAPKIYDPEKEYEVGELYALIEHACNTINPFLPVEYMFDALVERDKISILSGKNSIAVKFKQKIKPPKEGRIVEDTYGNYYISQGKFTNGCILLVNKAKRAGGYEYRLPEWRDYENPKHHSAGWKE